MVIATGPLTGAVAPTPGRFSASTKSPLTGTNERGRIYRKWVVYGSEHFSAKELTILPGRTVTIKDRGAYGAILLQGHGKVNTVSVDTPALIKYGELTNNELFVTAPAAEEGVKIVNQSDKDELVMLKHFGPGNPEAPTA